VGAEKKKHDQTGRVLLLPIRDRNNAKALTNAKSRTLT